MPDGSSSAAPVTRPGPRSARNAPMPRSRRPDAARSFPNQCPRCLPAGAVTDSAGPASRSWPLHVSSTSDLEIVLVSTAVRQEHREQEAHDADHDGSPERGPEAGDVKIEAE